MDRLLRDFAGRIRLELSDPSGVLVDADGPVSAAITDSAGGPLAGSPFVSAKPPGTTGIYEVTIPASANGVLDMYSVQWAATLDGQVSTSRSRYEVVGGFLFTIDELRAFDPVLSDMARYPQADLFAAREAAEERLERVCGLAFRPRGRRETISGDGSPYLLLDRVEPRAFVSAAIGVGSSRVPLTAPEVADVVLHPWGAAERRSLGVWTRGAGNVTALYEHGLLEPPEPVRRAALILARAAAVRSAVPDRATSESTDVGTIRYSIAGRDGPTGYPEVDAVIAQFGRAIPAIG